MSDHRATPDQWAYQEHWAQEDGDAACILELRARVEALEANTRDRNRVALIPLLILASYLITNSFIIAGVLRHWGPKGTQDTPVRDFKRSGDSCSAHATTMHEVDEVAIKLVGGHAGQFG
jgi:hypothetical protein